MGCGDSQKTTQQDNFSDPELIRSREPHLNLGPRRSLAWHLTAQARLKDHPPPPTHTRTLQVSTYSTTRAFVRPRQRNNTAAGPKSENKEPSVIYFSIPLFSRPSQQIIWAVECGNPYFACINFPGPFVHVMLQRVHHEKNICFPSASPSRTAEGRPADLLRPFVWARLAAPTLSVDV